MRREPEVIVRGEVDDSLAVKGADRRLLVIEHAQLEVRALGLEFFELIGQERKRIDPRGSGHSLPRNRRRANQFTTHSECGAPCNGRQLQIISPAAMSSLLGAPPFPDE